MARRDIIETPEFSITVTLVETFGLEGKGIQIGTDTLPFPCNFLGAQQDFRADLLKPERLRHP